MRSLESLGLKPDDNPSLSMVLLPIFDTKLPRELKEKWELELTKYETEEEDKEINIKKFFQFLEGHVLSKEALDDMKGSLPKHKRRMIYEGKECSVRILLDSGSQETFLRTAVADNLNMRRHGSPTNMKIKVLGGQEQHKRMNRVTFKLTPLDLNDGQMISIDAWTINNVCGPLAAVDVDVTRCNHLRNLKLADNFPRKAATVDLLVGADQYYKLVQGSIKRGRPGTPIATKPRLGWLLSGPVPGPKKKSTQWQLRK
ncbi:hypothetical protein ACROYT_G044204 [Oculina patagonica]